MAKAVFTCPQCQKVVRDLAGHTRRLHAAGPGSAGPGPDPVAAGQDPGPDPGPAPEVLTVLKPTKHGAASVAYHCVDCGADFTGQVPKCPGCGANFNWEGLQHED
jgi:hypothetical protein